MEKFYGMQTKVEKIIEKGYKVKILNFYNVKNTDLSQMNRLQLNKIDNHNFFKDLFYF